MRFCRFFQLIMGVLVWVSCSSTHTLSSDEAARNEALYTIGMNQLEDGQAREAAASLEQAYSANPTDRKIRMGLALAYMGIEAYSKAEALLKKACYESPPMPDCWNNLSALYIKMKQAQPALEYSQKALEVLTYPTPEFALANQAKALKMLGRLKEAEQKSRKAKALSSSNCELRILLCGILVARGKYSEALRESSFAAQMCPSRPRYSYWKGYVLALNGNKDLAYSHFQYIVDQFKTGEYVEKSVTAMELLDNKIPLAEPEI